MYLDHDEHIFAMLSFLTQSKCSGSSSHVCGVNGETFLSECHAHDVNILVDYYGRCRSMPGSGEFSCVKI